MQKYFLALVLICTFLQASNNYEQPQQPVMQYTGQNPKKYSNLKPVEVRDIEEFWFLLNLGNADAQHMDRTSGLPLEWCAHMRANRRSGNTSCRGMLVHFNKAREGTRSNKADSTQRVDDSIVKKTSDAKAEDVVLFYLAVL